MKKTQAEQRGYLLPETINPPQVSICICIPCDKNHALAFLGQINDLGYWWTWERDEAKQGKDAARVWREIYDDVNRQLNECGVFDMSCGCNDKPTRQRLNEDGLLEVSYDDGVTWQVDTTDDPRFSNPTLPPPDESTDQCVMANSIVTALQELQQDEYEALLAGTNLLQTIYNLLAAFVGIVIVVPIAIIPAIIALIISALVNLIADMIPEDFDDAFTEATWQDLLCILYCEMSADGSFSITQWQTVKDRVVSDIGGYAGTTWLHDTINLMGAVGLTNAARLGYGGSRDCSECDCTNTWCYTFDFETTDGEWERYASAGVLFGQWDTGTGWIYTDDTNVQTGITTAHRQLLILRGFDPTILTRVLVTYDYTGGTYDNTALTAFAVALDGGAVISLARSAMTNGDGQTAEWTNAGSEKSEIRISLRSSRDITSPYSYSGNAVIKSVRIEGRGTNPFGESNCEE
jgi:hypothetical protein